MHLMSSKSLALGKWLLPSITFLEIFSQNMLTFLKKYCANDFKTSFCLTKILSNYKNKLVIFIHSLEGNCCTCSTVNSKDSDKFNTKSSKKIKLAFENKKLQTFLHIVCTSLIPSSHICISDHQTCFSWNVKTNRDASDFFSPLLLKHYSLPSKILAPLLTNHVSTVEEKTNREQSHIKVLAILNQG